MSDQSTTSTHQAPPATGTVASTLNWAINAIVIAAVTWLTTQGGFEKILSARMEAREKKTGIIEEVRKVEGDDRALLAKYKDLQLTIERLARK